MKRKITQIYTEPKTFICLIVVIACSFIIYTHSINKTIFNSVQAQKLESQMSNLRSKIGSLEAQKMSIKNNITLRAASILGFREISSPEFISKNALGQAAGNRNEI